MKGTRWNLPQTSLEWQLKYFQNLKRKEIIERIYSDARRNCLSCQCSFSSSDRQVSTESYSTKLPILCQKRLSFPRLENKHPGIYSTFLNRQRQSPHWRLSDEITVLFLKLRLPSIVPLFLWVVFASFVFCLLLSFLFIRAKLPKLPRK